jgi:hypothetical protein
MPCQPICSDKNTNSSNFCNCNNNYAISEVTLECEKIPNLLFVMQDRVEELTSYIRFSFDQTLKEIQKPINSSILIYIENMKADYDYLIEAIDIL